MYSPGRLLSSDHLVPAFQLELSDGNWRAPGVLRRYPGAVDLGELPGQTLQESLAPFAATSTIESSPESGVERLLSGNYIEWLVLAGCRRRRSGSTAPFAVVGLGRLVGPLSARERAIEHRRTSVRTRCLAVALPLPSSVSMPQPEYGMPDAVESADFWHKGNLALGEHQRSAVKGLDSAFESKREPPFRSIAYRPHDPLQQDAFSGPDCA